MKSIYIFTDDEDFDRADSDYIEDYISQNFGGFTVIMSEDNNSILLSEEGDAYMVMEYVD
jgi:hypothetical protein